MRIALHFFSQLKEIVGTGETAIDLRDGATVADLLAQLYLAHPALEKWDRNILVGAGMDFVERTHILQPNDQIAIMPPVQGG
jgi:molybdopterin converting factor small subunit